MTKQFYQRPQVKDLVISIELGFANSIENPIENPEQEW